MSMNGKETDIEELQQRYCVETKQPCKITRQNDVLGFAIATQGKTPINGLRHLQQGDTSGWYIWCGEEFSSRPNFFSPLHAKHLIERCPDIVKFLGLVPGNRFLVAGDYVDVWFDESLLVTDNEVVTEIEDS